MSKDIVNNDVCLGVAIDHRLQKLFTKGESQLHPLHSNHADLVRQLGEDIRRPNDPITTDEIDVAAGLTGPARTGGVCFLLQQPAQNHPYHLGERKVTELSPTLNAITEVWRVVTMGQRKPSIFDRLPFTRLNDTTTEAYCATLQQRSMEILQAKCPEVIVCMWQKKRDSSGIAEDVASFEPFESLGVGRIFRSSDVEISPGIGIQRVNAFHPSYAVNRNPHLSCFRQLLILEMAHAWCLANNDWVEQEWMDELRRDCSQRASILAKQQRGSPISWQDIKRWYLVKMDEITAFLRMIGRPQIACSTAAELYKTLVRSHLSASLNDASLCVDRVVVEVAALHPDDVSRELEDIEDEMATSAWELLESVPPHYKAQVGAKILRNIQSGAELERLRDIVSDFAGDLASCFTNIRKGEEYESAEMALGHFPKVLTQFAVSFEAVCGRLGRTLDNDGNNDISAVFGQMNIGS